MQFNQIKIQIYKKVGGGAMMAVRGLDEYGRIVTHSFGPVDASNIHEEAQLQRENLNHQAEMRRARELAQEAAKAQSEQGQYSQKAVK